MTKECAVAKRKKRIYERENERSGNIKQQLVINRSGSCLFIINEYTRFQQPLFGVVIHFSILYNLSRYEFCVLKCALVCMCEHCFSAAFSLPILYVSRFSLAVASISQFFPFI